MIKEDVLQYLKNNFYIIQQGDSLVISNKFTRELGISPTDTKPIAIIPVVQTLGKTGKIDKDMYKLFIQEANVPTKIETGNGAYWANRYSESGFKAFKSVMENPAINRFVLLAATKWYYAQTRTARKMIGTYFSEGIWESCYDDFVKLRAQQVSKGIHTNSIPKMIEPIDENASNMEAG